MSDRQFSMDLAKLVIAAAWADGEVQHEEVNTLKHLMLSLPDVTGEDWRELQLYLDHPVTNDEFEALLDNVLDGIHGRRDRERVITTLTALVEADGVVTDEETAMLETVRQAVDSRGGGVVGAISGLIGRGVRALAGKGRRTVREDRMSEFIGNPVYFRLADRRGAFAVTDEHLRKASLVAGLMAKVACADNVVAPAEVASIRRRLESNWGLSSDDAKLLCDVGIERGLDGLDSYRLGESLKECSETSERKQLLGSLFRIAEADGLGEDEEVELRNISRCLGLNHRDLVEARLGA